MSGAQRTTPLARLAQTALAVAAFVFMWHVVLAVRLTPTETVALPSPAAAPRMGALLATSVSDAELERATAHDLFSPQREPLARASGSGTGTQDTDLGVATAGANDAQALPSVNGTAVSANGASFAMCALPGSNVVVVRVGDTLGAFTVAEIARTRVVFRDASGRRYTVEANASPAGDER